MEGAALSDLLSCIREAMDLGFDGMESGFREGETLSRCIELDDVGWR